MEDLILIGIAYIVLGNVFAMLHLEAMHNSVEKSDLDTHIEKSIALAIAIVIVAMTWPRAIYYHFK